MPNRYQVVIIGGGPVGVALGVELGQRGISTALIERHVTPQRIPKGQSLTNRTLEHFYFWNCEDKLRGARLMPPGYPIGGLSAYGSLMSDYWHIAGDIGAERGAFYYQKNERLPQYLTEQVLRRRLAELPSVHTMFGWGAKSFEQDDAGVRVAVVDEATGEEQVLEGDYVAGCDGPRSLVRESLGIDRHGADFGRKMCLCIFYSPELHEGLKRFPERTTYSVLDSTLSGGRYFFGRVEVGQTWFFHCPVPDDATQENFDFHALVQKAAGFPFAADFEHIGFFELRIAVADTYRAGRAFIAGDAAHTHPPYGGFGLNSGLEDVTNLGWKLAGKLQGWGGEALLDSYSGERQPIFAETGELQIAAGIRRAAEFAERYDPERNREEFEAAWDNFGSPDGGTTRAYDPHYEGSAVVMGEPGASIGIRGGRSIAAKAGHHLVPFKLSSGENVYEKLGGGYALLAFGADAKSVEVLSAAARAQAMPLTVVEDSFEDDRTSYGAQLILVRPDQHIAWAGDAAPADAAALMRRVTGSD